MLTALDRHERIALLFLLGIGIPSLFIGFLAFRGIRNEVALLDQRSWEAHRLLARQVTASVSMRIDATERLVYSALQERLDSSGSTVGVDLRDLPFPLVEAAFTLFPDSAHVLWPPLLYGNESSLEVGTSAPLESQLRAAERLEFREGRPEGALAMYRQAIGGPVTPRTRASLLLSMARLQRRIRAYGVVEASLLELLTAYDSVPALGGVPFGAISMLELGSLAVEAGDVTGGATTWITLYEKLLSGRWHLGRDQFAFLSHRARASLREALPRVEPSRGRDSLAAVIQRLRRAEAERTAQTDRLLLFRQAALPRLRDRLAAASTKGDEGGDRFPLEADGTSFLVVLSKLPLSGKPWGILVDGDALVAEVIAPELTRPTASVGAGWVLRSRDGETIAGTMTPSEGATATATFEGGVPPWLLEVYRAPTSVGGLKLTRNPYLYLLIFFATLLAFGLAVTARAVSREMELARLKARFVSTVSHEFKSPLTSIRHIAEMLLDGRVPAADRRRRYYRVLVEQSNRLSALVSNVLDSARVEEGKDEPRFEPVSAAAALRGAVATIQERFGEGRLEVQVDVEEGLPPVKADPDALAVVLTNLLDNAARYADGSGGIHVRAALAANSTGRVALSVRDFGAGIPPRERHRIFHRFVRGREAGALHPLGTGLGLALVKELVEGHGGSVEVDAPPGGGSSFTVSLPVWDPDERGA
jgi:signal transduction histidine kinase